jgi:[Skp1-protein]-hydroxyproline N-acetylglucosaminyltransferase
VCVCVCVCVCLRLFLQTFGKDWDAISIKGLKNAPSKKPVLSHYPPGHTQDLNAMADQAGSRLCGPIFAPSDLESQIVRLEGNGQYDHVKMDTPRFAPFTGTCARVHMN